MKNKKECYFLFSRAFGFVGAVQAEGNKLSLTNKKTQELTEQQVACSDPSHLEFVFCSDITQALLLSRNKAFFLQEKAKHLPNIGKALLSE